MLQNAQHFVDRLVAALHKTRWGARVVGWPATITGVFRLVRVRLTKPERAEVRLRSTGQILTFQYPSQFAGALVVFRDLIDPEYSFLREVGKPDWVFVDVGAAIGQFTVFAAGAIGGYVHAFEPSPINLATLAENVSRNGLEDRVAIHSLALSDRSGQEMFEAEANAFMGHLAADGQASKSVRVETLSRIAAELRIERISVLKINVAGGEPAVIAGALDFLAGGGAAILVVLIGPQTFEALGQLADLGYRFFFFHPGERQLHEVFSLDETGLSVDQPWPARHVIGIWSDSVNEIAGDKVGVKKAGR